MKAQDLIEEGRRAIAAQIPEDEPDMVPDWVVETLIAVGLQAARNVMAEALVYPQEWDTAAYPTLEDALHETSAWHKEARKQDQEDEQGEA